MFKVLLTGYTYLVFAASAAGGRQLSAAMRPDLDRLAPSLNLRFEEPQPYCFSSAVIGSAIACGCFSVDPHAGDGVDRIDAGDAVGYACQSFAEKTWGKEEGMWSAFVYLWEFDHPRRVINVTLEIREAVPDLGQCEGVRITERDCYYSFMQAVDRCDTDGENGKHGGWSADPCFIWTIDPDPVEGYTKEAEKAGVNDPGGND